MQVTRRGLLLGAASGAVAVSLGLGCGTEPHALARYPRLHSKYVVSGAAGGVYRGRGADALHYELPRYQSELRAAQRFPVSAGRDSLSLADFEQLLLEAAGTDVRARIEAVIDEARRLASGSSPTAAPFTDAEVDRIRSELLVLWHHSEDVGVVTSALGYRFESRGQHDVAQPVSAAAARAVSGPRSPWYDSYLETLGEVLDAGFFNPHLVANFDTWRPGAPVEDGVAAHRLSMHHDGHPSVGWDPLESAVNAICHRREHRIGIRRAPRTEWAELTATLQNPATAAKLAGSEVGVEIARDAATTIEQLERAGKVTPWHLVRAT